jgi:hypothetical protein
MSDLDRRNALATCQALNALNEDVAMIRAELVELRKQYSQVLQQLQRIEQRQIHGLAAQIGTGATS